MDAAHHEFVNFGVKEVITDMRLFSERLRRVNPAARMIVTVSPVPLIATFEDRHVLVSTTASKSILRAAADEITRGDPASDYFPSYEIITRNYARGAYFEKDLRSVAPAGVRHVMRLFFFTSRLRRALPYSPTKFPAKARPYVKLSATRKPSINEPEYGHSSGQLPTAVFSTRQSPN